MKKKAAVLFAITIISVMLLSGATAAEAKETKITICSADREYELCFRISPKDRLAKIFLYDNSYVTYCQKAFSGNETSFLWYLNKDISEQAQEMIVGEYEPPVEPEAVFTEKGFLYNEGKDGVRVVEKKLFADIVTALDDGARVYIKKEAVSPTKNIEELKQNTKRLAEFGTEYSRSGQGRKRNIAVAVERINLAVVPARGFFGYNAVVGRRTEQNGFFEANVIIDGEYVAGVGGGVCQVSTTLYLAWLIAGLEVAVSSPHSLPVGYVAPALDAMVSESSDLILYNNTDYPAYIAAVCDGKNMTVTIFGSPSGYEIRVGSETTKREAADYERTVADDIDWQEGETCRIVKKAYDGLVCRSYRDYYADNKLVKREPIKTVYYKKRDGKMLIRPTAD